MLLKKKTKNCTCFWTGPKPEHPGVSWFYTFPLWASSPQVQGSALARNLPIRRRGVNPIERGPLFFLGWTSRRNPNESTLAKALSMQRWQPWLKSDNPGCGSIQRWTMKNGSKSCDGSFPNRSSSQWKSYRYRRKTNGSCRIMSYATTQVLMIKQFFSSQLHSNLRSAIVHRIPAKPNKAKPWKLYNTQLKRASKLLTTTIYIIPSPIPSWYHVPLHLFKSSLLTNPKFCAAFPQKWYPLSGAPPEK